MTTDILHFEDIILSKIKFKKMYNSSSNFSKVVIKYRKHSLIIQTPKLFIPYDLQFYGYCDNNTKCYIYLSLSNYKVQKEVGDFCNKINAIEQLVKKKYERKCYLKKKRKFSDSIKNDMYKNLSLKIRIPFYKKTPMIKVFNQDKKEINFDDINAKMYCETLLCIEGIWFFKDTFGLTINLLQIKLDIPILIEEYSFSNKIQDDINIYRYDPTYKSYFKMLNMGIPIFVVKQKMTLVGLNPDILDGADCSNSQVPKSNVTLNLLNGRLTLRKVSSKKRDNHINKMNSMGHNVPSLDAIVNTLASLKKVRRTSVA